MNIDFNLNLFLNIIENIINNNIITYIIPKKDNFDKSGKVMPVHDFFDNKYKNINNSIQCIYDDLYQNIDEEFLNYEMLNKSDESLNSELIINNKLSNYYFDDKYNFNYDIESGLYDIEIGYISLMESNFNNKYENKYGIDNLAEINNNIAEINNNLADISNN